MYVAGRTPLDAPGPGRPSGDSAAVPAERDVLLRGLVAFSELGYDRASARELARRLGVSHTFINDRYGSKAAFWRAVVDAALGDQLTSMTPAPPGAMTRTCMAVRHGVLPRQRRRTVPGLAAGG
ncbi:TetR/AcrR family transcriptional regulator [Streptomyces bottropensis]|uniref:TetR/AcrR family transcriptional regulator n=1 Tax=Streptomyces bottropensis TaxID=42235 RepID=UPI0037AB2E9D